MGDRRDKAKFVARVAGVPLALSIVSLIAGVAQIVGLVAFFAFESLYPYRWWLLLGGTAVIFVVEILKQVWARSVMRADDSANV